LPAEEILALVAQLVGNLIAVQDQRRYSSKQIVDLVWNNIEIGNKVAVEGLLDSQGSA
jgi:hypothetical protein